MNHLSPILRALVSAVGAAGRYRSLLAALASAARQIVCRMPSRQQTCRRWLVRGAALQRIDPTHCQVDRCASATPRHANERPETRHGNVCATRRLSYRRCLTAGFHRESRRQLAFAGRQILAVRFFYFIAQTRYYMARPLLRFICINNISRRSQRAAQWAGCLRPKLSRALGVIGNASQHLARQGKRKEGVQLSAFSCVVIENAAHSQRTNAPTLLMMSRFCRRLFH